MVRKMPLEKVHSLTSSPLNSTTVCRAMHLNRHVTSRNDIVCSGPAPGGQRCDTAGRRCKLIDLLGRDPCDMDNIASYDGLDCQESS